MDLSGESKLFCMGYPQELKGYRKLVCQNTLASEPSPKLDPNFVFTGKMDGDKDPRCTSTGKKAQLARPTVQRVWGFRFSGLCLARNEGRILIVVLRTYHSSFHFLFHSFIPSYPKAWGSRLWFGVCQNTRTGSLSVKAEARLNLPKRLRIRPTLRSLRLSLDALGFPYTYTPIILRCYKRSTHGSTCKKTCTCARNAPHSSALDSYTGVLGPPPEL